MFNSVKKWLLSSLQNRIVMMLLMVTLIPPFIIGFFAYQEAYSVIEKNSYVAKQTQVGRVADRLEQYLTDHKASISALAKNPAIQSMGSSEQTAAMKAFQEGIGAFELIFVVDPQGIIKNTYPYTNFGGKIDFTDRQWFKDVVKQQKTVISDTYVSAFTKQATAPIVTPILGANGQVLGYIGGNLSLSNLGSLVGLLNDGQTGRGIALDGKMFYLNDSRDEQKGKSYELFQDSSVVKMIQNGEAKTQADQGQVTAYMPVGTTGWAILAVQEQNEFLSEAFALKGRMLLQIALAAVLLSIFTGYYSYRFLRKAILQPLHGLGQAAAQIAEGNLTSEKVVCERHDEIGQLASSFHKMAQNLRSIIEQVAGAAKSITDSASLLNQTSNHSARAANQISTSVTEIACGSSLQAQAVAETSKSVAKIAETVGEASGNAKQIVARAETTSETAQNGLKAVTTAIQQIDQVSQTVANSTKIVNRLGENSSQITQIVETISGIAGQTNLLALNAAIEAARAGEHGKGFAVVAGEVKKLAEQSQGATEKIAALLLEIQQDTAQAVQAMVKGNEEASRGSEVVHQAGAAFQGIHSHVCEVSDQVKDMAEFVQNTSSTIENIVHSVRQIDEVSHKNAAETQNVSAATEEQSASMEEVAALCHKLEGLAHDLEGAVKQFKL